jgi:hypothetical protein
VKEPVPSEGLSALCGLSAGNGGARRDGIAGIQGNRRQRGFGKLQIPKDLTEFESHPFAIHTSSVTASAAERSIRYS